MSEENIAIVLYGFLRDFNQHCTSLRENILEEFDTDLYGYFPLERSEDDLTKIPNGVLKKVYGVDNVEKLRRWEYDAEPFIEDAQEFPKFNWTNQSAWRILSMMHHIQEAMKLVEEKGGSYDWVFLTRPDLSFRELNIEKAERDKINILNNDAHLVKKHDVEFDDKWVLSSPENMLCLTNLYESAIKYSRGSGIGREPDQVPPGNTLICHHLAVNGNDFNRSNYVDASFDHVCSSYCGHRIRYGDEHKESEIHDYENILERYKE